jgi:hypothetical protein
MAFSLNPRKKDWRPKASREPRFAPGQLDKTGVLDGSSRLLAECGCWARETRHCDTREFAFARQSIVVAGMVNVVRPRSRARQGASD